MSPLSNFKRKIMLLVKMQVGKAEKSLKIVSEMRGIYKTDSKSYDY